MTQRSLSYSERIQYDKDFAVTIGPIVCPTTVPLPFFNGIFDRSTIQYEGYLQLREWWLSMEWSAAWRHSIVDYIPWHSTEWRTPSPPVMQQIPCCMSGSGDLFTDGHPSTFQWNDFCYPLTNGSVSTLAPPRMQPGLANPTGQ